MEKTEKTVNSSEPVISDSVTANVSAEADTAVGADSGDTGVCEPMGETVLFEDTGDAGYDEEAELSELRRISGIEYGSLSDFSGYQRYLELKKSGVLTAEEAFYAVNRGKKEKVKEYDTSYTPGTLYAFDGSKRHMSATRRKPSSGEVFTRADREELAKWGISATGSELERLWREAGRA